MLVLTRKPGESIILGDEVTITVSHVTGKRVKICVDAPRECSIVRAELVQELGRPAGASRFRVPALAR